MTDNPVTHGGNLDEAILRFGGTASEWIDLSTGINPYSYPFNPPAQHAYTALPTAAVISGLEKQAQHYYQTSLACCAVSGAQSAIQLLAHYCSTDYRTVSILSPTYNEYQRAFSHIGMQVTLTTDLHRLQQAEIAILCSPNNPTGNHISTEQIEQLAQQVQLVILDESFADCVAAPTILRQLASSFTNIVSLRSFGKFFGLAGLRLGFILGAPQMISILRDFAGPWPVSGVAADIAVQAFADHHWQEQTREELNRLAQISDRLAAGAGWRLEGGCALFRLYTVEDSTATQKALAHHHIWSRIFEYNPHWIRLGTPHHQHLQRLEKAFTSLHD